MLTPNYVLCASGTPSTPTLDVIINAATDIEADNVTKRTIKTLAKVGYTGFTLYTVSPPGGNDVILATYNVDLKEPLVFHGTINNIGAPKS